LIIFLVESLVLAREKNSQPASLKHGGRDGVAVFLGAAERFREKLLKKPYMLSPSIS